MPSPVSKLLLPQQGLAGCIFAAIYRDTRGVKLSDRDRINHFPASPLVSVSFVVRGDLIIVPVAQHLDRPVHDEAIPRCFAMGPADTPVSSWSPGEVTALTIGFYHDAWLRLGGDPEFRCVPGRLEEMFSVFAEAPDPDQGWDEVCAKLGSVWGDVRPKGWRSTGGIADWAQATITRAALAGAGRSLRTLERQLKRMSGQTRRSLDFYSAFENLHQVASQTPDSPLAEVALAAGYADQSHMGRAVRRATGFTPAQLNKAVRTDEAFWCYRLLGERF